MSVPVAYQGNTSAAVADWLNKGDNAWQLTASTLVGLMSVPGMVVLYGGVVKKKWAVNSAFMALYAFAAVWICWVVWAYNMSFGEELLPFWGKAGPALDQAFLVGRASLPATAHYRADGSLETAMVEPYFPMATVVYFQCVFAAITLILVAGSLLGRMSFLAWMLFVPLWLTFSYTVGAFSWFDTFAPGDTGVVQGWAALVMGVLAGSVPWYTMMVLHKRSKLLQRVDDTLGVIHTHGVAGLLGGVLTGLFAEPNLCNLFLPVTNSRGAFYGGNGGAQLGKQIAGALFVIGWNVVVTSIICVVIRLVVPLRMSEEKLAIGDDAVHGEEAYALWGDGEHYDDTKHGAAVVPV
ncbi:Ammonium transporter 3 member 2 [Triticum urartu]|uniref:Ammonium transporter AmtB-like domain-containing protein n=2 Tax=Triticum TaxID=4564 RepID=A0A9R0SM06_TRITD|nr:Ammonium transporter 3 member 2 [Triticum urartu]VAH97263.1 unnamed protein product [Triticum turgidum subsp. durum]